MPPLTSRLNLKNLENSDQSEMPSGDTKPRSTGSSDTEMKNSSIPINRNNENKSDHKDSSNDASNETSDSDKSLITQMSIPAKAKALALSRDEPEDNEADDELPTDSNNNGEDVQASDASAPLEKRFFCSVCNQGFTRKHNMVSHELIHLSSKPHVCLLCKILFRRIHDLKRHEKLHTGEKPFHCDKCDRRFARTDALTRHLNSPNACTGKPKEEDVNDGEINPEPIQEAKPVASSSSSSNSILTTGFSAKTTSTETTNESNLSSEGTKDALQHPATQRDVSLAAVSVSSDSLGGISDTINKSNYDVHRWRAFQHQQNSQGHGNRFPYNTTTTTTTTTVTTENERGEKQATRHREVRGEQPPNNSPHFPDRDGQHYHHHYHHHHHHNNEEEQRRIQPSGMESWSIPSDREMLNNGQFRKHDDYYPKDIRASRKEPETSHSSGEFHATQENRRNIQALPPGPELQAADRYRPNNVYSSYSDGNFQLGQLYHGRVENSPYHQWPPQPDQKLHTPQQPSRPPLARFVSMEKYADLVNYTNDLQASLTKMDDRIKFLERAEHKREFDDDEPQLPLKRSKKD